MSLSPPVHCQGKRKEQRVLPLPWQRKLGRLLRVDERGEHEVLLCRRAAGGAAADGVCRRQRAVLAVYGSPGFDIPEGGCDRRQSAERTSFQSVGGDEAHFRQHADEGSVHRAKE